MAVAVEDVATLLRVAERRLRVVPMDEPRRYELAACIEDLRLLHEWLSSATTAQSAAVLGASRQTIDLAQCVLREVKAK